MAHTYGSGLQSNLSGTQHASPKTTAKWAQRCIGIGSKVVINTLWSSGLLGHETTFRIACQAFVTHTSSYGDRQSLAWPLGLMFVPQASDEP